jgi:hypothetical protein
MVLMDVTRNVTRNVILDNAKCRLNVSLTPICVYFAVTLPIGHVTLMPGGSALT